MIRSIKELCGSKLGALDGEIGQVKDFYFDDQHWAIRYVVADTGSWIPGRQVLLSPHAFGRFRPGSKNLPVNLVRKQIEDSPAMESHKPITRQYEEEYYRYYGWPFYWQGGAVWGLSGFPILSERSKPFSGELPARPSSKEKHLEVHLQSAQAVLGYQIQTGDEIIGCVVDLMIDDKRWVICHLVVNTGNRFSGKKVLLSPNQVERLCWNESKIFVNRTTEDLAGILPGDISATAGSPSKSG